jgi:hypothetical protein
MENGWQKVFSSQLLHQVEIIRAVLAENDINSVVVDKRDSSYVMLGDINIFVRNEDAILARIIIEQNKF